MYSAVQRPMSLPSVTITYKNWHLSFLPIYYLHKVWVGVDWCAVPPVLIRCQGQDGEVQMRREGICVAAGSYVSNHIAAIHMLAFRQFRGIAIQRCVVAHKHARFVEQR